jgi:hypothetical protein
MNTSDGSGSLQMQIDAVEGRLVERRSRVVADLLGIGQRFRAGMTAPGTLLVAFGVGVVVEQGSHERTWSLVPVLQGISVIRGLLVTLTSLVKSLDVASAS